MVRDNFVSCVFVLLLINLVTDLGIEAMEFYSDGEPFNTRSSCPDDEGFGCNNDDDCTTKISKGSLNENCSKCICWNVPVCDVKK